MYYCCLILKGANVGVGGGGWGLSKKRIVVLRTGTFFTVPVLFGTFRDQLLYGTFRVLLPHLKKE